MSYETKRQFRFLYHKSYLLVKLEKNKIYILYLYVEEELRRCGLGKLLLVFSITKMKDLYPSIQKVLLDDCSNNVCSLRRNIYRNLGFRFVCKAKN